MKQYLCAAVLFALLLAPLFQAQAAPITVTSSTFASSTVSSTVSQINTWFEDKMGVDIYGLINKAIAFVVKVVKITIDILLEILPKIKDFLSSY